MKPNQSKFPAGWDEARVKKLLAELDARSEEDWIMADESAGNGTTEQSTVTVPTSLLPEIRRLLAEHKSV
jgi:hypothetical protein